MSLLQLYTSAFSCLSQGFLLKNLATDCFHFFCTAAQLNINIPISGLTLVFINVGWARGLLSGSQKSICTKWMEEKHIQVFNISIRWTLGSVRLSLHREHKLNPTIACSDMVPGHTKSQRVHILLFQNVKSTSSQYVHVCHPTVLATKYISAIQINWIAEIIHFLEKEGVQMTKSIECMNR